jgi:DNA mismatch repair protein MSH2
VEIFVNVAKESQKKDGKIKEIKWVAKYKGSPGNLAQFEDLLFANNESQMTVNNGVMGIRIGFVDKTKTVGVAHVNLNECEIHLIEFADNDDLTNLESVLVQLCPKEAVTALSQSEDLNTLRKVIIITN